MASQASAKAWLQSDWNWEMAQHLSDPKNWLRARLRVWLGVLGFGGWFFFCCNESSSALTCPVLPCPVFPCLFPRHSPYEQGMPLRSCTIHNPPVREKGGEEKSNRAPNVWRELVKMINDNRLFGSWSSSTLWRRGGQWSTPEAMMKGQGSHPAKTSERAQRNSQHGPYWYLQI